MTNSVLIIKIIWTITNYRYRNKLIGLNSPNITTRNTRSTVQLFFNWEVSIFVKNYFCNSYITRYRMIIFKSMNFTIKLNFCFKSLTASSSKLTYKESICIRLHMRFVRPCNIFYWRFALHLLHWSSNVNIKLPTHPRHPRFPAIAIIDFITIWFNTMSIKITIIILRLIPHDGKSKHTVNITSCSFNILFHVWIGNIATIGPG